MSEQEKVSTPRSSAGMDCPKLEDEGPPSGTSSPLVAAMSTVNLVVGVGILYLPAVFVQCGVVMAVVLSAIVAYSCWYTSQLIVRIGMQIKKYSYEEICQVVLGDFGYITLAASCIMFNWGATLCYLLTIKSMAASVLARALLNVTWIPAWLATPAMLMLILCLPFLWWLSLLKNLDALSFVSIIKAGVVSVTVLTIFVTSQTASVQDSLHFDRWNKEQLVSFFDDITDKVETASGEPVYQKHMDTYLKAITGQPTEDEKSAAAWALVDAVDQEPGWKDPLRVRTTLRRLVNRENPKVREANYVKSGDNKGELEKVESEHPSFKQPDGVFKRMTYFAPYLFCHQFFLKMGTICFAFVFHDSIFSVYKSMKTPTVATWKNSSIMFIIAAFVIQVLFGCFIGLTFGTSTPSNVLTSSYSEGAVFPADNILSQIIQVAFSIVLLLTYPACIVICREFVESIMMLYRKPDLGKEPVPISRFTQLVIASILVLLTVPFLFFEDAGEVAEQVLDLVGAFACGLMAFVLPSIVFWKTAKLYPELGKNLSTLDRIMPYAVLVLGAYTCLVSPVLQILEMAGVFSVEMPLPPQHAEL